MYYNVLFFKNIFVYFSRYFICVLYEILTTVVVKSSIFIIRQHGGLSQNIEFFNILITFHKCTKFQAIFITKQRGLSSNALDFIEEVLCSILDCDTNYPCRAIARAVSPWLPTAEARVRARVWS
jgi:hypothetical protein